MLHSQPYWRIVVVVLLLTAILVARLEAFSLVSLSTTSVDRAQCKLCSSGSDNNLESEGHHLDRMRRGLFLSAMMIPAAPEMAKPTVFSPTTTAMVSEESMITVPLKFTGQELLIYYRVDGSLFRAVLDTGSPFLMIPGSCGENTKATSGCYRNQGVPSGLDGTVEIFDGFQGDVDWRMAPFSFVNATGSMQGPSLITFGVVSESIMTGPGGVFFGMVRDTDSWIRPSFLGQTSVQSFQLNLATVPRTLSLSTRPMIPTGKDHDYIRLTSDLRKKYGDPVNHYTARAKSVSANGFPLAADGKPIYVIFDTGVTGMVVSRDLFDERYAAARERRERNLWGNVEVSFCTSQGKTVSISATKPLTTPFDPQVTWNKFRNGHLIVMGLSFLDGNNLTIDIDKERLWIES
jgi:hypothetical protein